MKLSPKRSIPRLVLCGALGASACADLGDRAESGDCPTSQDCSPSTPRGLSFESAGFRGLGGGISPVAIGGRIDLRITDLATRGELLRPYRASTGGALTVEAQRGSVVSLRGISTAPDTLRISDPQNDQLFDQIGVLAAPIETVRVSAGFLHDLSLLYLPREAQARPPALLAGARASLIFELLAADETRVIDEDLEVSGDGVAFEEGSSWDLRSATAGAAGTLGLSLRAGGRAWSLQLPVVSEPEAVEGALSAERIRVGDTPAACFNAIAGGRNVLGAPWTFTSAGVTGSRLLQTGCFVIETLTAAGPASVTATSGNRTLTLAFTVEPAATRSAAPSTIPAFSLAPSDVLHTSPDAIDTAPSLGERADG